MTIPLLIIATILLYGGLDKYIHARPTNTSAVETFTLVLFLCVFSFTYTMFLITVINTC